MIVSVIVQACTIYRALRSWRMAFGTFWSFPFQLLITLIRWASKAATEVACQVAIEMENQTQHERHVFQGDVK